MEYFTQADFSQGYVHLSKMCKFGMKAGYHEEILGVLFQIFCGLSKEEINSLYWKDLYTLDSDRNPIITNRLKIREYKISIPLPLQEALKDYHAKMNYIVSDYVPLFIKAPNSDLRPIFANRLFEVNGYSDEAIKDLKIQFKIRNSKELLKFCGLSDKEDISYGFNHINLDLNKSPIAKLKDKNFNNGDYYFQSFSSFSRFLKNSYPDALYRENSIRLLLWSSVYSGIRMSQFLKFDWNSILYFDYDQMRVYMHSKIEMLGNQFIAPSDLKARFLLLFESYLITKNFESYVINYSEETKHHTPNPFLPDWNGFGDRIIFDEYENPYFDVKDFPVDFLSHKIFLNKNFKPISPNNLAREMRAALFHLGHGNPDNFKANSTLIMWARRIIEIKGDHKATIRKLKKHFYFRTKLELAKFLSLVDEDGKIEFEGIKHPNKFEEVAFDF